jgi:hypothetical protein
MKNKNMATLNTKITKLYKDLDLGEITETKKLFLLDEINSLLTKRIIIELINNTPEEKKKLFINKIKENKDHPDKIVLFIDHFVANADKIIDGEIIKLKNELIKKLS